MDVFTLDASYLSAIICIVLLGYLFKGAFSTSNAYWEELGVPYVKRWPLVGNLLFFNKKQFHEVDYERYKKFKKYGRMYGVYEGLTPALVVYDLDVIRKIWVKDFSVFTGRRSFTSGDPMSDNMMSIVNGDKWKRIRCTVSPSFSTGRIKRMTDIFVSCAKIMAKNFAETNGKPTDVKKIFNTFTMDAIASVAFATKVHSYKDPNNMFVQQASKVFQRKLSLKFLMFFFFPGIFRIFKISPFATGVMKFFRNAVLEIIKDRKENGTIRHDFLQSMIDAEKEGQELENGKILNAFDEVEKTLDDKNAEELGHEENIEQIFKTPKSMKVISYDEMISQCVLFFLAGFDTTASTLAFACRELALNPEVQEKLKKDVDSVIERHDGKLTYEGIQEMKYLDYVVSETLRMYPPAFRIERKADVDYKIEDTDITIKKGTIIIAPVYGIHHDPEYYEEPEKFIPERFTSDEKIKRHPYSYLTFGAGPRNCVAMRFALMEVKLCLAYTISQFRIEATEETKKPLDIFSGMGVLQPANVIMSFHIREDRVFSGL